MKAKQYEVIGSLPVHGHLPGERFWATYKPDVERLLLGVHIAVVLEQIRPREDFRRRPPAGPRDEADRGAPEANNDSKEK